MDLRPYQAQSIENFHTAISDGCNRNLIVLPTGTGKTVTGLALAASTNARMLWLAHREELIYQPRNAARYVSPSTTTGICKALVNDISAQWVFASIQTASVPKRLAQLAAQHWDLVVVDEAHHAPSDQYTGVLSALGCIGGTVPLLGLTATPERSDGRSLSAIFDRVVYQLHLRTAIEQGYLAPTEIVSHPINVDLDAIARSGMDFSRADLDVALLQAGVVANVCDAYERHATQHRTCIFTVGVEQSQLITQELQQRGHAAAHIDGASTNRADTLQQFADGNIRVIANCNVLTEGFDDPGLSCIIVARPTLSKSLYLQMIGRGLRKHPLKEHCLIIDLVGASTRHTLVHASALLTDQPQSEKQQGRASKANDERTLDYWSQRLNAQVLGVKPLEQSALRWIQSDPDTYAISAGAHGTISIRKLGDVYAVTLVGHHSGFRELSSDPVSLELAQGIAEDFIRQARAVGFSDRDAGWRPLKATETQIKTLRRLGIPVDEMTITRGEAADLLTLHAARDKKNEQATPKQIKYLRRLGVAVAGVMSKREAGRLIAGRTNKNRG